MLRGKQVRMTGFDICQEMIVMQRGVVAQMVERSLSMREALGSIPNYSIFFNFLIIVFKI